MNDKTQIVTMLREELGRWEELLAGISKAQATAPHPRSEWSIKDTVAHLYAWQQLSIARLEAALHNGEPEFSEWPTELDPDSEDDVDQINVLIYQAHREQPWSDVRRDWKEGYLRFLELAEAIPERELLDPGRYAWLGGHPLSLVLLGSCEHHREHRESWLARLGQLGNRSAE